jgi:leucyl-tRNA---protein transferase
MDVNVPLTERRFFLTPEHPCSYLDGEQARTLFLDPEATVDSSSYELLSAVGFRRSGTHLYRPQCDRCAACIPTRIPVADFRPRRTQRRIRQRNMDLTATLETPRWSEEYYTLYSDYVSIRHRDGDMFPPSETQFKTFLDGGWSDTQFLSLRLDGRLVAVAVTDRLPHALSAIYTFFDPALATRSLGVYAVLAQIQACADADLPHLYLGYWIRDCRKMTYKIDFRPIELFIRNRWIRLS